ncbi:MAG: hypothetical protein AMJ56_06520 [Anaerolineae bacterium SG8_19]|nr:MAG: hypothetical protein AMJ56_06520 [Anaerolineae bacterium SG8_19]
MSSNQFPQTLYKLRDVFESHRDRPWIFLRPLGNWGDDLIFAGAERMADSLGLNWRSFETVEFQAMATTSDHCIYLHGGGGFNHWCSGRAIVNLELALNRSVHLVVQGPVSTEGSSEWLADRFKQALSCIRPRDFLFFAREKFTLQVLNDVELPKLGATLCLDHDTALALSDEDVLAIAELKSMPIGNYDLIVLREDPEQPIRPTTGGMWTGSLASRAITLDPAYAAINFRHWVRIHLYAKSIITNRLHSSIIGTVAGKPVTLGPGSYHKNRSVWDYSLANRGVQWTDSIESPPNTLWNRLPKRIQNSYKVRRLRLAVNRVPLS